MKENQSVKPIINMEAGTVTFEVRGHSPLVLHMDKVHPDNVRRASFVGMAQTRIVDAAAVGLMDAAGRVIPAAERDAMKHANMAELIAHYESGTPEWSRKGTGTSDGGLLFTALCRAYPDQTTEQVREFLAGLDDATKRALPADEAIAPIIAEIKRERAPKDVDTTAILKKLGAKLVI